RAAQQAFIPDGINRILLATDGDFNVGVTDFQQLKAMVEEKRKSGVALTTLGFGTGNYNEQLMEQLADAGDGAYSYIDTLMEGHKVLVNEMTSTLATIARDVKVQVEFNPAAVREYRLIGYENRTLQREDFNNDRVDAGDIGAGHTVTALYELTLADGTGLIDDSRYGLNDARPAGRHGDELAHVKLRFKEPGADTSRRLDMAVRKASMKPLALASGELRFALAVAGFGQMLRGGRYTGEWTFFDARALAGSAVGADRFGYRGEFLRLVDLAQSLSTRKVGEAGAVVVPRGR
ncbi:MAG: YfbK domain-containing protein, partial [Betaproteobacteria bacterium]